MPDNSKFHFQNDELTNGGANDAGGTQAFFGTVPELPPRIDRTSKPPGTIPNIYGSSTSTPSKSSGGTIGRSAQERLFGQQLKSEIMSSDFVDEYSTTANRVNALSLDSRVAAAAANGSSLDRKLNSLDRSANAASAGGGVGGGVVGNKKNGSYDSVSSYDSCNTTQMSMQRLGPNAPDDLKSVPPSK